MTTLARVVGGPARLRVVVLLALVVGLQSADNGTVGALVVPLERSLHIGNTQVGLLVTVSTAVGAVATLPAGMLADHVIRVRMVWIAVLMWSAAMVLSGASTSYGWLIACRMALGAIVAVAGPVVASLIGDFFPSEERGRAYGFVLAGEGICTAAGLLVPGMLAAVSWRLGFWWLAVLGLPLAVAVAKMLPEPARGGRSRLRVGATRIVSAEEVRRAPMTFLGTEEPKNPCQPQTATRSQETSESIVATEVATQNIQPHPSHVLHDSTRGRSLWWAVRYVLSVRTNVVLIVASSLGYFFFTGLSTFGVALLRGRFQIGQAVATLLVGAIGVGALIGVLSTGRIADWLIGRGHIGSRMTVSGTAFIAAAVCSLPVLLTHSLAMAVVFAFLAAVGLGGVNPPLDAGRLDIMHSRLWGRAEAVRTALRSAVTGIAPLVFGFLSTQLGGAVGGSPSAIGGQSGAMAAPGQPAGAAGLDHTFLIMLGPLILAGALILLLARRFYPRDVATAAASEAAAVEADRPPPR